MDGENGDAEFEAQGFDPRKKFFRTKLNGHCVLGMKLKAGSVQTQKSLIPTCKHTVQVAPLQTEADYAV
jgi:hypothetical protein